MNQSTDLHDIAVGTKELSGEVKDATAQLRELITELSKATSHNSGGGKAEVHISAGGIGVGVAVACCAFMLAMNIALIVLLVRQDREISEMGHQLNAIYMMAPHLKPEQTP